MAAKTRFHRGITSNFRMMLRRAGIAVDEELAHRMLAGKPVATGVAEGIVDKARLAALNNSSEVTRFDLMRSWENDHPGQRPFPPPFAQRVLDLTREIETLLEMEGNPTILMGQLRALCLSELSDDDDLYDN